MSRAINKVQTGTPLLVHEKKSQVGVTLLAMKMGGNNN